MAWKGPYPTQCNDLLTFKSDDAVSAFLRPHSILNCRLTKVYVPDLKSGTVRSMRRVSMGCSMRLLACVIALCGAFSALSETQATAQELATTAKARYMRVHGQSLPPYGFVRFCQVFNSECRPDQKRTRRVMVNPHLLSQLDTINRKVNLAIAPATDLAVYGVDEHWTFPKKRGDCEDYVILKRKKLMQLGWSASSLLITVVLDEHGEGHAVLTVRTGQGDFILDNKVNDVRLFSQTPYQYIMRQSYLDPRVWVSLDRHAVASPHAIAGVQSTR